MKSLEEVQDFCDGISSVSQPSKHGRSKVWKCLGAFCVSLTLGMVIFYPVFNNKSGLDVISSWMGSDAPVVLGVGDKEPEPVVVQKDEPYLYTEFIRSF